MKDKGLLIAAGLGLAYLYFKSKPGIGTVYPAGFVGPTQPGSTILTGSPAGSLVGWLSNIFHGGAGSSTTNPGNVPLATDGATDITDINQIGAQPEPTNMTDISQGCVSNGNVCDPNDCDYNAQVCNEMNGGSGLIPGSA
jgi:hypothetical protein